MDPLGHMHLQEGHVRGKPPYTGFATSFFPIEATSVCLSQKDSKQDSASNHGPQSIQKTK